MQHVTPEHSPADLIVHYLPECPGADHDTGARAAGLPIAAGSGCAPRISWGGVLELAQHRSETRTVNRSSPAPVASQRR
jgi:hypothetical protein